MEIKDMIKVALFTSLTMIGGMLSINIGPVPITMQTVFVLLSGLLLGPKLGVYSQIVYIFLGIVGLPVFAGGMSGPGSFLSPSFGFVLGFILAANTVGWIIQSMEYNSRNITLALIVGNGVIFLIGIPYMYFILNIYMGNSLNIIQILNIGLIPFIPGEVLKVLLGINIGIRMKFLNRENIIDIK